MTPEQIMSFLRTFLNFLGGWMVSLGYLNTSVMEQAVGALLTIIAAIWGWYTHKPVAVPTKVADLPPQ